MDKINELALFAGAGGGLLASRLLGWRTVCAVEIEPYCREVLLSRQREGLLPRFPIWDDVRTFDAAPWRGIVDIVTGGFPCQDISAAGKGKGLAGSASGLVFEMLSIVNEIRPRFVFAENSPHLRTRGLGSILEIFDSMGYDARWCVLGAWHVGAPHRRNRMWILAYDNSRVQYDESVDAKMACAQTTEGDVTDFASIGRDKGWERNGSEQGTRRSETWWAAQPGVGRVFFNGMAIELGENLNVLQSMWEEAGKEKIWEATRRPWSLQEENLLRQIMYGYWISKGESIKERHWQATHKGTEIILRDVRNSRASLCTSQGQKSHEQRQAEFNDALCFLSYAFASRTGRLGKKEARQAVSYMRQAIIQISTMFNASDTFKTAWRSLDSQWKASVILTRWNYEPPLSNVVYGMAHRVDRIKALGNGQVPAVAATAWKLLSDGLIDNKSEVKK